MRAEIRELQAWLSLERNIQYDSFVLQGRPLYDNDADAQFFVVPDQWNPLVRALERGLNVALVGSRGVGKTTLLHQLQRSLRTNGERVAFVDANAVVGADELAARLRDGLVGRPGLNELRPDLTALTGDPNPPAAGASRAFHDTLQSLGEVEPTVVLVDASSSGAAVFEVFGRMRDTMWQLPHTWVVALDESDLGNALKPPADAFFDTVVRLEPLSTNDLAELLSRRAPQTPGPMLGRVAAMAKGSPRAALRALSDAAIHDSDPTGGLVERGMLLDRAAALGRPHGMLMAELLDRGQASPSDEGLQRTLGVSRARLTTLLRELLDRELVVTGTEKADGPGRPRTVYRPALEDS